LPVRASIARLGCAGPPLAETAACLLRHLPQPGGAATAGPSIRAADALAGRFDLPGTIRYLPGWDAPWRARAVGCWGARLAGLTPSLPAAADESILIDAAAFNLAVALFDTVVDEMPRALPPLAEALRPVVLRQWLEHPESGDPPRIQLEDETAVVVHLFAYVLKSAGRRYRDDPVTLAALGDLLRRMYESETGVSSQPALAKTLPIVWIGSLTGVRSGSEADRMFHRLAHFIARWDDAQDLHDDWVHGRYNAYLAISRDRWSPVGGALIGSSRLVFARRSVARIRCDLEASLLEALAAADGCGRRNEAACFLADLLEGAG
jgi:hypothetical protein